MVYRYFKIPIYYLVLSFTYIRHSRNTDSQIIQSSNFKSKFTHPNGAFESFFVYMNYLICLDLYLF